MAINLRYNIVTKIIWVVLVVFIILGILWGIWVEDDFGIGYELPILIGIVLSIAIWYALIKTLHLEGHLKFRVVEDDPNEKKPNKVPVVVNHTPDSDRTEEKKIITPFIPTPEQKEVFKEYEEKYDIIANSKEMLNVFRKIDAYKSDIMVLITGESGVGKELVAKAIYNQSNRKDKRYFMINCANLDSDKAVTDLFGSKKGAFTDAIDREGFFQHYNNDTIFFDEIAKLPTDIQSMLLRVLQDGDFVIQGSNELGETNVRVGKSGNIRTVIPVTFGQLFRWFFGHPDSRDFHYVPTCKVLNTWQVCP